MKVGLGAWSKPINVNWKVLHVYQNKLLSKFLSNSVYIWRTFNLFWVDQFRSLLILLNSPMLFSTVFVILFPILAWISGSFMLGSAEIDLLIGARPGDFLKTTKNLIKKLPNWILKTLGNPWHCLYIYQSDNQLSISSVQFSSNKFI